jgi:hypothetical protein
MTRVQSSLTVLTIAASVLLGCGDAPPAPSGVRISDQELCLFRYAKTTPGDVVKRLGAPSTSGSAGALILFRYDYQDPGAGLLESVTFAFNAGLLYEVMRANVMGTGALIVPACLTASP